MAEVIEEKWPKSLTASIFFLFVLILMLITVVPNKTLDSALLKERMWGIELLGSSDMDKVLEQTNAIYTALVIDSGAKEIVSDLLMSRGGTVDAFEEKTGWWFDYLAARGEALQKIIYQMVYRAILTAYWLPLFVAVLVPAIYAGWMRWSAKRHGFDYSSPFLNNNAANILSWGGVMIILSVLLPLPLPPLVISTFVVIMLPVVLSLLISNLPKRI